MMLIRTCGLSHKMERYERGGERERGEGRRGEEGEVELTPIFSFLFGNHRFFFFSLLFLSSLLFSFIRLP